MEEGEEFKIEKNRASVRIVASRDRRAMRRWRRWRMNVTMQAVVRIVKMNCRLIIIA